MKNLSIAFLTVLLFSSVSATAAEKPHPPSLLIETTRNADKQAIDDFLTENGCTILGEAHSTKCGIHVIEVAPKSGDLTQFKQKIEKVKNANIKSIEITPLTRLEALPNDPDSPQQYALGIMNFSSALNIIGNHQKITPRFTLVDTGVQPVSGELTHVSQYNFVNGANGTPESPFDSGIHGTAVAGTGAATTDNHNLIAGVGTSNLPVRITSCRISNDGGTINTLDVIQALLWCVDNQALRGGPGPINVSLGSTAPPTYNGSSVVQDIAHELRNQGDLLVLAAGNNAMLDPSPELYARRVAGTDQNNQLASFSVFGPFHGAAPAVNIIIIPSLALESGTSLAAPYWSGSIALLQSLNPRLNAVQADSIIYNQANVTGADWHIPNLFKAVNSARF
ncbi:MAG: S8 family serine peptidase [Cyanobacteria bacterium SZAS-4]|nr:S8 family serine peptidase [Cyanobacteria bacterium SZAS-4]